MLFDVLGVFDQGFSSLFFGAKYMSVDVNPTKKVMEHPIEDGSNITDFAIKNPDEIKLDIVLSPFLYQQTYQDIKALYDNNTLITVVTKVDQYSNMIVSAIPYKQDGSIINTIAISIMLKKVNIVSAQYGQLPPRAVKKPSDATTVDGGEKASEDISGAKALKDLIF